MPRRRRTRKAPIPTSPVLAPLPPTKDFLTLWKDADPDIPILKQAKSRDATLQ